MMDSDWKVDEWTGCYPSNWKGLIVTEAMAHPAKFSSRLIRQIYAHLQGEGWVRPGDSVIDPFGGVALGGLEAMREGGFGAAVSSPPYDEARVGTESGQEHCGQGDQYGETDGQLGGADDFWMAAREIVEEVYAALEPGGHAAWVVKDYVKAKKIVPFSDQWRQLCEAVGFVTVHEHRALLVRNRRVQGTLEGGSVVLQSESKSFFRRLAEKKGSPRIDWETVWCMVK